MSEDGSTEIIIKGGSCELYFDHEAFTRDEVDLKKRHGSKDIKQIIIIGDGEFASLDTGEHSTKFTGTIKIICS